ncbi:CIC11C00000000713 [Sungouiella intermedia]|uniref:CIC11C00000000713 n=1 Tax=Sungouiella intermedia TaxID=45354 RepID=A0A1L0C459_9ASCO|nr:CIC11C00000000713 [[Candida] intermedia]SGZ58393.1 CIC11C00000005318 [[Candida] intermedia]
MSNYNPPTGPPPNWDDKQQSAPLGNQSQTDRGYAPPQQPHYQQQGYGGGYGQQGPPQGGYYQQGPPQGGYYQQQPQQQYYVQQQKSSSSNGCLMGCLAALCMCCTLDALF